MNENQQSLTLPAFLRSLEMQGADLSRWPQPAAAAARILIAQDAQARMAYEEARALDDMLGAYEAGKLPDIVMARVAQAIDRAPARSVNDNYGSYRFGLDRARALTRGWRDAPRFALAACAALVLLVAGGTQWPVSAPVTAQADDVELFMISMADPFIETLRAEEMMAPLVMAESRHTGMEIDLFLDDMMEDYLRDI